MPMHSETGKKTLAESECPNPLATVVGPGTGIWTIHKIFPDFPNLNHQVRTLLLISKDSLVLTGKAAEEQQIQELGKKRGGRWKEGRSYSQLAHLSSWIQLSLRPAQSLSCPQYISANKVTPPPRHHLLLCLSRLKLGYCHSQELVGYAILFKIV